MPSQVVQEEQHLLVEVSTLLEEEPYIAPPKEGDIVNELLRLREEMPQAKEEDKGALMAQYNQLLQILDQLRDARQKEDVDPDCPYFAHIRLNESGKRRDLCLGKATRIQRGVRIVDWRNAPISRVFYQYRQGEEYEEEFGNRWVEGIVEARRTVTIRHGKLERIDSPDGSFQLTDGEWTREEREAPRLAGGQGTAMQVYTAGKGGHRRLGTDLAGHRKRSDKRLPDIAGLIDAEQFALITKPTSGFVVIRGTAGSGKTTVALHRIAWMAYEEPAVNSANTLFLVFSRALRDYVGHVLPALGVHKVQVKTFVEWAAHQRRRHFPRLPNPVRDDTPAVVVRLKLHPVMLVALEKQVERVTGPTNGEQALDDFMSVMTDLDFLKDIIRVHAPGAFTDKQLERVTTWCRDRNNELNERLDGDKSAPCMMDAEDDSLLLRAWQLRAGSLRGKKRRPLRYRHVALDEVQDFSPIDVRVLLGCLDQRKSITLAGDTQQHVMNDAGFTSWSEFFAHLGVKGVAVNTLAVSYRSSNQIVTFAMKLLGDLREDDTMPLTTRQGPAAELFRFTNTGAAVAFLADALKELLIQEPMASIAVLTPSGGVSAAYYDGLDKAEVPRLRRVVDQDFLFAPGIEVTEISQVKGLEFDYVILVETSARAYPDTPTARRLLHVGATRAVHQLWLVTVADLSPIVKEAMA